MAKKARKNKKLQKERKDAKLRIEKEANRKFNESEPVKSMQKLPKIDPKHYELLKDFAGPKPKPPKRKTLYSGRTPPTPPAVLFDLIHNFLRGKNIDNHVSDPHALTKSRFQVCQGCAWTTDG